MLAGGCSTSTIQSARRTTSISCSTTNSELPTAFNPSSARSRSLCIGGMESGRRLVHHIDDPEQVGDDLGRQVQPLEFARRQGWRASLQRQIAEAEVEQDRQPRRASAAIRSTTSAFSGCVLRSALSLPLRPSA